MHGPLNVKCSEASMQDCTCCMDNYDQTLKRQFYFIISGSKPMNMHYLNVLKSEGQSLVLSLCFEISARNISHKTQI